MIYKKNAIISVYDKENLDLIAKFLVKKKFNIYSSGGTSSYLKKIEFLTLKYLIIQIREILGVE